MIPKSCITLLCLFCSGFSFISALGGGGAGDTKDFFLILSLESFPITSRRFALKYNLYAFCIFKACFLSLSRVIVFKEPAQPVTCFEKIRLHFGVPFECHSLDLTSVLCNSYVPAPHKSTMLDGVKKLQTLGKACGLALGEGREQNLCIC